MKNLFFWGLWKTRFIFPKLNEKFSKTICALITFVGGRFRISVNFYLCKHAQLVASGIDDIQDVDPHSKLFDAVVYDEVLHNDFSDSARVPRLIVDAFAAFRQCREVFHLHIEHIKISSRGIRGKQSIGNIAAQPAEIIRGIKRYDDFIQIHSNRDLV